MAATAKRKGRLSRKKRGQKMKKTTPTSSSLLESNKKETISRQTHKGQETTKDILERSKKKEAVETSEEEEDEIETEPSSAGEEEEDGSSNEEDGTKDKVGHDGKKPKDSKDADKSPGRKGVPSKKQNKEADKDDSCSNEDDDDDESSSNGDDGENRGNDNVDSFFTDENAAWLKPKKRAPQLKSSIHAKKKKTKSELISSDDDDSESAENGNDEFVGASTSGIGDNAEEDDDDDDDDDEEEELLEVEKQSRLLDAELESEKREAEEEYQLTINQQTEIFHLPTPQELEEEANRVVPPSELRARIDSILEVLSAFQKRREPGRSRTEYIDQLTADLAELYGYLPELVSYLISMFGPSETVEYIDSSEKPRPIVIRTNTLKTRRRDLASALIKRGMTLDPLASWSKVGLKVTASSVPVGATPDYLAGHYMLQSAASMCPVIALSPQPGENVLDMSAAPGGKTSYIAQLMRNTGIVIANDLKAERQKATVANLHRLGVKNVVTCVGDGRRLGSKMARRFDRVLLDAPCSGLGVISRDPSVKVSRTVDDIKKSGHLQKELLLAAIDAVNAKSKSGGYVVYSTCSVAVAENEEVVNYALSKRDVRVVDAGLDFGKPGFTRYQQKRFHPSLANTRRFYPHVHNMDGFYVAKLQKLSDKLPGEEKQKAEGEEDNVKELADDKAEIEARGESDSDNDRVEEEFGNLNKSTKANNDGKPVAPSKKEGHSKNKKHLAEKGKKRRISAEADRVGKDKKKSKGSHISIPPTVKQKQQQKKKKTNAKITKPRRRKVNDAA